MVLLDRLTQRYRGETTRSLLECLNERNLGVSIRQLQRELSFLRRYFLVVPKETRRGITRWCWVEQDACFLEGEWKKAQQAMELPLDSSLRDPGKKHFLDSSMSKLLRVLTLVELIPIEEDNAWVSINELCQGLQIRGLAASVRTLQRDIGFIKDHFLIVHRQRPGGEQELQRLEFHEWQTSFCPRLPGSDDPEAPEYSRVTSALLNYPHAMGRA